MTKDNLLSELSGLCAKFFESTSWDQLIHKILSTSIQVTKADRGTIFIAQPKHGAGKGGEEELVSLIATGMGTQKISIPSNQGIAGYVYTTGAPLIENKAHENKMFLASIDGQTSYETKKILCIPLVTPSGKKLGVLELLNKANEESDFDHFDLQAGQVLALYASLALEQNKNTETLKEDKNILLDERNERLSVIKDDQLLQTNHAGLQQTFSQLPLMAESDSSVLIGGESGTGKELIARYLHLHSPRKNKAFIVINCAAIPDNLFEAELFGVVKGAATDVAERKGKIELANGGTLFLDEIGEMPVSAQAKLLRVLQEKVVCRVGGEDEEIPVDFRLLAATHRDLPGLVKEGEFREDLFFRLNVLNIQLPPLRKRPKDIDAICESIMEHFAKTRGWKKASMSVKALEALKTYNWPGNIRELQNRLERAIILAGARTTLVEEDFDLSSNPLAKDDDEQISSVKIGNVSLKEAKDQVEKTHIERVLHEVEGNRSKACEILQLSREGLRKAMLKHKIVA